MVDELRFDNKVVIITGAGGGLGKTYALLYASKGAKVVVNDLGGSLGGSGGSTRAADVVVDEIKAKGGVAVANYDNIVTNADGILKTAIDNFGTVHVLVNNAGILKDSSFKNMTEKQFQDVIDVHLNGTFKLTKLCWPYFQKQKYGRIVNTASPAGLFGNFGQANYSAGKLGQVGLAETLAKEGYKYNIKANVIAPLARSRMTEDILPPDILKKLSADKIAPLVVYLSHDSVKTTGAIYECAAGWYGQIRWERSGGVYFKPDESFTPEAIQLKFKEILKFDKDIQHPIQVNDYNKVYEITKKLPPNEQGSAKISLKGKVVVITGAGSGIGRSHALFFARYGAKVVVNDFKDPDACVNEIKSKGGEAVGAKFDVYSEAEKIVETAIKTYGRIDILINNAGILRDRSFAKMSQKEWDQVLQIHLLAVFRLTKLCWPIFLKQKFGRVINTTSTSGIYGNFGQANYAAGKAAVLGFSRTLAIEGAKHNIITNIIAPHAETAMTKTIFTENELNKFDPSQVSPLLIVLTQDKPPTNGELFEIGAGWIGNTRWQRARGAVSHDDPPAPEFVASNIDTITRFGPDSLHPRSTQESSMAILASIEDQDEEDDDDEDDDEGKTAKVESFKYDHRHVILYNLSIGAKATDLKFVYENSKDFQVIPSFGVIPPMVQEDGGLNISAITKNFNPMLLLHGEQYLKVNNPNIPTSGELYTKSFPVAVINKGKNCVVIGGFETILKETNEVLFYNEMSSFIRNCSSKTGEDKFYRKPAAFNSNDFKPPKTEPDFTGSFTTSEDQLALYRLNADFNPLHIDPQFAKGAKFDKPILHGLGSFGISTKLLYEKFGKFTDMKLRFTNVVFPGETLIVKAWKKSNDFVVWEAWVKERNICVIASAGFKLGSSKGSKL